MTNMKKRPMATASEALAILKRLLAAVTHQSKQHTNKSGYLHNRRIYLEETARRYRRGRRACLTGKIRHGRQMLYWNAA